ncbi:hypothetical protein [Thalassotalea crassostreae]|uniref:hypothetical protein n=1 Tax=Thalassotalea crassostreae TaxID=1763536 RepID=UPI000838BE4F|nr:hypothetical protein [Thalassotalea crassostreae]
MAVWFSFDDEAYVFEEVVGLVENSGAALHQMGHTSFLSVRLSDLKVPIKIEVPRGAKIKIGSKLLLSKATLKSSDKSTYTFVRYVDL